MVTFLQSIFTLTFVLSAQKEYLEISCLIYLPAQKKLADIGRHRRVTFKYHKRN